MLFVAILTNRPNMTPEQQQEGFVRRATYQFPEGTRQIAEYWPVGPIPVIAIFEADSFEPIFKVTLDWQDLFDIAVYPATTAEDGLMLGAKFMGSQPA